MNKQPKLNDIRGACWTLLRALEDYESTFKVTPFKRTLRVHLEIASVDRARDTIRKAFNIEKGPLEAARRKVNKKAGGPL